MATQQKLERVDSPRGRQYVYGPNGERYPSVTTVCKITEDPQALMIWHAKIQREHDIKVTGELHREMAEALPQDEWEKAYFQKGGKKYAAHVKRDDAAAVGTGVHERIEWHIKTKLELPVGPMPGLTDEGENAYAKWLKWAKHVEFEPDCYIEQRLISHELRTAGTSDLLIANFNIKRDSMPDLVSIEDAEKWKPLINTRQRCIVDWKTSSGIYLGSRVQVSVYAHCAVEMGLFEPPVFAQLVNIPKTGDKFTAETIAPWQQGKYIDGFKAARTIYDLRAGEK